MSSDNTVADRLLDDARKKTARQENPATGKVALIVGAIALLVSPVSILGWIVFRELRWREKRAKSAEQTLS